MAAKRPIQTIGRAEEVVLPDFSLAIVAKIDTGAVGCSVWASDINEDETGLSFKLLGSESPDYTGKTIFVKKGEYSQSIVKSSFGHKEIRYNTKFRIRLGGRLIKATFSLSDREKMVYPMLIGRRLLHGKFVVDVAGGAPLIDEEELALERQKALQALKHPTKSGLRIAILSKGSGNYTTKRLKAAALERGHEVRVINYAQCYMTMEKGKPLIFYKGKELPDFDVIIPRIAQSYTKYGTAVVRQFEMRGAFSTASSIAINRSRDKLRSYQIMARQDVGIPKTVFARETANLEEVVDLVGGAPVIIKVARGTHGNGVVLAETKKAAKAVMQAFYVEGVNFLVQEFVKESAGTDIRVLVVGNRVVASVMRQSLDDDFRSNTHQGGFGTKVKLTAEEEKTAIRAAKAMNLPFCGVDMMRSADGPKVLEVNSSASIKTPELITGRDVATKIIEYIERNAKARPRKDKVGA